MAITNNPAGPRLRPTVPGTTTTGPAAGTTTPTPAVTPQAAPVPAAPAKARVDAQVQADARARGVAAGAGAAPAAVGTPSVPLTDGLRSVMQATPMKTNEDLLRYLHTKGGGTWNGTAEAGKAIGVNVYDLVRDRKAPLPVVPA